MTASTLTEQLRAVMPPAMIIPPAIEQLHAWIEQNGYFIDDERGRYGMLWPVDKTSEDEMELSCHTTGFRAYGQNMAEWLGSEVTPDRYEGRFCTFARTGGDGSHAAFWLDDDGKQKIIHLGSGSGSTLACVLADDAVDFLRLLAIGYGEFSFADFSKEPNTEGPATFPDSDFVYTPPEVISNTEFQQWVRESFAVDIPKNGINIVRHPAQMGDDESQDSFARWLAAL